MGASSRAARTRAAARRSKTASRPDPAASKLPSLHRDGSTARPHGVRFAEDSDNGGGVESCPPLRSRSAVSLPSPDARDRSPGLRTASARGSGGMLAGVPEDDGEGEPEFTAAELRLLRHVEDLRRRQNEYLLSIVREEQLAEDDRERQLRSVRRKEHRRAMEKKHARERRKAEDRIMRIAQDNELVINRKLAEAGLATLHRGS